MLQNKVLRFCCCLLLCLQLAQGQEAAAVCNLALGTITIEDINCDTDTYTTIIVVNYTDAPAEDFEVLIDGTQQGTTWGIAPAVGSSGTQTLTVTGLPTNGTQDIDLTVRFATTETCSVTLADALDAPTACTDIDQCAATGNLFINEVFAGTGTEYIELVTYGGAMDLNGWIIDDNNVNISSNGNAAGHLYITTLDPSCSALANVPAGTIILIYDEDAPPAGVTEDKDPTDGVVMLPGNSLCIAGCNDNPSAQTPPPALDETYLPCNEPLAAGTTDFSNASGYANGGDVAQVRNPQGELEHMLYWSNPTLATNLSAANPGELVNMGTADANSTTRAIFALNCGDWTAAANYTPSDPTTATPGAPNNCANDALIYSIKNGSVSCANFAPTCAAMTLTPQTPTCLTNTAGTDNYSVVVNFSNGATHDYTITPNAGTVTLSNNPDNTAAGSFTITGVPEGTNLSFNVTVASLTGAACNIPLSVTSPTCVAVCDNVTSPGSIEAAQSNCGTFDPALLTELTAPTGGTGALEYQWQISTTSAVSGFADIASATAMTYDPPSTSVTTWYRRCVRRAGCTAFTPTAAVEITINALPTFTGTVTCSGGSGTGSISQVATGGSGSGYTYNITGGSFGPNLANGDYDVTVTDSNGCINATVITVNCVAGCAVPSNMQFAP